MIKWEVIPSKDGDGWVVRWLSEKRLDYQYQRVFWSLIAAPTVHSSISEATDAAVNSARETWESEGEYSDVYIFFTNSVTQVLYIPATQQRRHANEL